MRKLLITLLKYFVITTFVLGVIMMGYIGISFAKYSFMSFRETDTSLTSFLKGDLSPSQEQLLNNTMNKKMETVSDKILEKAYAIFNLVQLDIDGAIPEENKSIYIDYVYVPMSGDELIEFMEENDKMQQETLRKAIKDAEDFNNTTLKEAREEGIKNAGGID